MITVTPEAAEQIRESARQGKLEGMPLRIAVTRLEDGSFHYALGFDDNSHDSDKTFQSEGIDIVVAPQSMDILDGTVIDYVDLEG
ncbi:MAG: iron-sulfur cluster assembly accessory protein, partial [Pseudomonadota bacterium]|nr:iron-sulfur cluster assembly accessory protein [Pseudomonadota bacterium]